MRKRSLLAGVLVLTWLFAAASPAAGATKTCNGTLTGSYDSVAVPNGGSCLLSGANVDGAVTVGTNAYFEAATTSIGGTVTATSALTVFLRDGSTVGGSVSTNGTAQVYVFGSTINRNLVALASFKDYGAVYVCGTLVKGNLKTKEMGQDIVIGNADPAGDCAGNTVRGFAYVIANSTYVETLVSGNNVTGELRVNKTQDTGLKSVDHNTGGTILTCKRNAAPFVGLPNFGFASQIGQCQ